MGKTAKEQTAIGPTLFWPLLVIPVLGYGALNLPHYTSKAMGSNGYLGVALGALAVLPGVAAIYLLARRFPGQTLIEYGVAILGPVIGRIAGLAYLGANTVLMSIFTRDQLNMVMSYILNRTPLFVVVLIFLAIEAYLASRGLETIARLAAFVILPALLVMAVLTVLGYQNVAFIHLKPFTSPRLLDYARGALAGSGKFLSLGASAMILPYLRPVSSFPRLAGWALALLLAVYTSIAVGVIGVFGYPHLLHYAWPALEFVHAIDYPYLLLEQAGLLMLIEWAALVVICTGFLCYTLALGLRQLTGLWDYKKFVWLLVVAKYFLIILPASLAETKWGMDLVIKYGGLAFFAYPIILWLLAVVLGRRGSAHAG